MVIITIDGAAGTGKTTVGILTANRLNFDFLDTGKIYRAFTLKLIKDSISLEKKEIIKHLDKTKINYSYKEKKESVYLNKIDITDEILSKEVDNNVSLVSKIPEVRDKMTSLQRSIVSDKNFVVVGRDIGTVVLPNAELKIFLIASIEERARRRFAEREDQSYSDILESIKNRDVIDSTREVAPLKTPENAVIIDTEGIDIIEVSNKIIKEIDNEHSI
ncbi:MAG: cytidylate kinase [Dehalococcoidia bacterium]|nr:cytidylate kinase [Dehalococcoidia bacterium]MQG04621.1 (d)CMP kinase [SAR202 cluster bacterium]